MFKCYPTFLSNLIYKTRSNELNDTLFKLVYLNVNKSMKLRLTVVYKENHNAEKNIFSDKFWI